MLVEQRTILAIEHGIESEIRRRRRLTLSDGEHEVVLAHRLQGVVAGTLLTDGRRRIGREVLAAGGTGAVRREDPGCVGQGEQPLVERVVELAGEFVGGDTDRREQVGTTDVADEHGVAGEHGVRRLVVGVLVDHDRDRFGRVARGVTDLERDVAEVVALAIGEAAGFELGDGDIAVPDLRPGGGSQFEVA